MASARRIMLSTTTENVDLISSLPDGIICHILSFLPTEESIRTTVLSTRFKNLFSLVPALNFSNPYNGSPDTHTDFLDFVDWVFNWYNAHNMDTFRLTSSKIDPEISRLPSWISKSISRGVQKLDVEVLPLVPAMAQKLPCEILTYKKLTTLSLKGVFRVHVPKDMCLPHLKTLKLVGVFFVNGPESARDLVLSCTVLKELFLERCRIAEDIDQVYEVSSLSLRNLTIVHGFPGNSKVVIDCPNLKYLKYSAKDWPYITKLRHKADTTQALRLLTVAHINYDVSYEEQYEAFGKLVKAVCNVRHLRFSGSTWMALILGGSFPMFSNLTHLELNNTLFPGLNLVLDFLERTPHLQVLVLDSVPSTPEKYHETGQQILFFPEQVPTCVSLHLKKVELKGFSKLGDEYQMVEYFLKNGKNLDMLKIQFKGPSSPRRQMKTINKLLSFSKCSRACEIVLLSDVGET